MFKQKQNKIQHVITNLQTGEYSIIPEDELTEDDLCENCPICEQMKDELQLRNKTPFRRQGPKTRRNSLCLCGSGRKYKFCCGSRR